MLLGHGWHDKVELLKAADEVTQDDAVGAGRTLWERACNRPLMPEESSLSSIVPTSAEGPDAPSGHPNERADSSDGKTAQLSAVEADLFVAKPNGGGRELPVVLPRDITEYAFDEDEVRFFWEPPFRNLVV